MASGKEPQGGGGLAHTGEQPGRECGEVAPELVHQLETEGDLIGGNKQGEKWGNDRQVRSDGFKMGEKQVGRSALSIDYWYGLCEEIREDLNNNGGVPVPVLNAVLMRTSGRTVPGPCCRSTASSLSCSSAATRWAAAHVDDGAWAWAVRQRCARSCAVRVATMLLRSCREVSADEGLCCCCCCRSPRCCRMNVALLLFRAAADRTAPMRGRMLRATGRAAEAADAFAGKNGALRIMKVIHRHCTDSECLSESPNEFQLNLTVRY